MTTDSQREQQSRIAQLAVLFAGYAILCLVSALALTSGGDMLAHGSFPSGQGSTPPFKITKANTVIHVSVTQKVPLIGNGESGTFITATLLDERGEYLMSFGNDLWTAAGRDAEGRWAESQTNTAGDFTIPEPGTYSFSLESEFTAVQPAAVRKNPAGLGGYSNKAGQRDSDGAVQPNSDGLNPNGLPKMDVKITQRRGSNIMLLWLGWPAALIAGGLTWMYASLVQKGSS